MPLPSGWKKKSPEESELLEDFTFLNVIVCPFDDDLNEVCPVEKKGSVSLIIKIICLRHLWKKLDTIYHLQKKDVECYPTYEITLSFGQGKKSKISNAFTPTKKTEFNYFHFPNLEAKKYYAGKCPVLNSLLLWLVY